MSGPRLTFLVVDHHPESRFLLVKCLGRKFPAAVVRETETGEGAVEFARAGGVAAIIVHRTREHADTELVERIRAVDPAVPIVMVSGIERSASALAAGADRFLLYDEWLRIGTLVKDLIAAGRRPQVVHLEVPPPGEGEKKRRDG